MNLLIAFLTSFCFVGLKAFQTLNVSGKQYLWVLPTSMCMAGCEVFLISTAAKGYGLIVVAMGLGAGLGCMASMRLHQWLTQRK